MFKFIGKALADLVLTKDAQRAVGQIQIVPGGGKTKAGSAGGPGAAGDMTARQQAIAEAQKGAGDLMTPDRAELIRHAMKVRSAKQTILDSLDDETRAKLVAAAMKALLKEGHDEE